MSYYRRNRSGNKKIYFRILFVLAAALIITILSVFLGIYLQHKVNAAEDMEYAYPEEEIVDSPGLSADFEAMEVSDIYGAGFDISQYGSEDEIVLSINRLADYYNTLTLPLTDETGTLIYTSPALCEALRMPVPSEHPVFDLISAAATAGQVKNMRICALIAPAEDFAFDAVLIRELASMGFDEVLFAPEFGESISYLQALAFRDFLSDCAEDAAITCSLGVMLPAGHFIRTADAKHIQMIASAADFLAVTFDSETNETTASAYRKVTGEVSSILGSFSVYHMRVILTDDNRDILSAKVKACLDKSIRSIGITSPVLPTEMIYSDEYQAQEPDAAETSRHTNEKGETNPYSGGSTTYPSYQNAAPETEGE